ncbi:MAG: D-xylose transporter XylE [Bacteroidota bacterium]|jgi:SP family xylose:H+ symportor-like MFS transporter
MKQYNPSASLHFITFSATLGGLLFGYDTAVISGAIGNLTVYFKLTTLEIGWAISSALVGCLLGAMLSDFWSTRWGRKKALLFAALLFVLNSIGTALPESFSIFILFRIIGGVGVGLASMVVPMYLAEIAPSNRRGALVGKYQLAIVIGIVLVYFVNYFIALQGDASWNLTQGWRWMFASELLPSVLFFATVYTIPESPRWLIQKGAYEKAKEVLTVFHATNDAALELQTLQESIQTTENNPWLSLRLPKYRKALAVGIGLSILQQLTGINAILYYAPEIFKSLGSSIHASLWETSVLGVVNLMATILAIRWVDRVGRRPLLIYGSIGMIFALLGVGSLLYFQVGPTYVLPFLILFMASFSISWGPVVWVVLSELFPNAVRSLALAISVFVQWIANFLVTQYFPYLVENTWVPNSLKSAFPFLVFALFCFIALLFVWKKVPETKHTTLEQMDSLWD